MGRGITIQMRELIRQLADRRNELGLSQQAVSEKIGVTDSLVGRWECGDRTPSGFALLNWIESLGGKMQVNFNQD